MKLFIVDLNDYVGIPYADGKGGGLDCWQLIQKVYSDKHDVTLPDAIGVWQSTSAAPKSEGVIKPMFRQLDKPVDGCVIYCGTGRFMSHVGIWSMGHVLHSQREVGSMLERMTNFSFRFKKIEFWEYANNTD